MIRPLAAALATAVTLTAVGAGVGASAQTLSRMIADTGLTPDDFTILSDTARRLYDMPNPQPGPAVSWTNPESGSQGTVRLAAMRDGCAYLLHVVQAAGGSAPREIKLRRCRDANGKWVLTP
jgi:hypothetical protein